MCVPTWLSASSENVFFLPANFRVFHFPIFMLNEGTNAPWQIPGIADKLYSPSFYFFKSERGKMCLIDN